MDDPRDPTPVTDPDVLERIEAEFILRVYVAARDAEWQRLGMLPPPPERPNAQALLQRARERLGPR